MHWQSYHNVLLTLAETAETLTDSQREAGHRLRQEIYDFQQRINLYGGPGVGKSFLAHYLHHRAEGLYFSSVEKFQRDPISRNSIIIIDNAPHDRQSARLIYGDIEWVGAASVILITRQPIDDAVRRVELVLTRRDVVQVEAVMCEQFRHPAFAEDLSGPERRKSGIWARM